MTNAVGYFRVSTLEQATGNNSIPTQTRKFETFCASSRLTSLRTFTDKESARTTARPHFQEMLDFCRKNKAKVSCVVVADLSRFARNVVDQGSSIAALAQIGIKVISIDEPIVDSTAAGKLAAGMIGVFNQFFSDSLSEKTKFRMEVGVKQGRWLWVAPLGYLNDVRTKTVVLDSERAPLIRKAFELLGEEISIGDTMRQVTALGLRTRKGHVVPKQTFSRMLRNPFYCGWIQSNGTTIRGVHEPLISEDLFDTVQKRLKGHAPHQVERDDFVLRGFVHCGKCGKNLTAGMVTGRSQKYPRYWCWSKDCKSVNVRAEYLENQFANILNLIQPEAELLAELPRLASHAWAERKTRIATDSKTLTRRIDDQRALKERAIKAKLMGELDDADFQTVKKSVEGEVARIEEQIQALDNEHDSMEDLMKQTEDAVLDFRESWRVAIPARKRELQNCLFPDGLAFDSELGYFCPQNPSLMQLIKDIFEMFKTTEAAVSSGVPDGI